MMRFLICVKVGFRYGEFIRILHGFLQSELWAMHGYANSSVDQKAFHWSVLALAMPVCECGSADVDVPQPAQSREPILGQQNGDRVWYVNYISLFLWWWPMQLAQFAEFHPHLFKKD